MYQFKIMLTVFGCTTHNKEGTGKDGKPALNSGGWTLPTVAKLKTINSGSDIDYLNYMMYNGGQWLGKWASPPGSYGWCHYLIDSKMGMFPAGYTEQNLNTKIFLTMYPASSDTSELPRQYCCNSCIAEAAKFVNKGQVSGIGFWCYGGYLGGGNNADNFKLIENYSKVLRTTGSIKSLDYDDSNISNCSSQQQTGCSDIKTGTCNQGCSSSTNNLPIQNVYSAMNNAGYKII